jgi:hypothetical protein
MGSPQVFQGGVWGACRRALGPSGRTLTVLLRFLNKKARTLLEGPGFFVGVMLVRLKRASAPFPLEREAIPRPARHRGDAQGNLAGYFECCGCFH